MSDFIKNLAALIKVKTIVTLIVVIVWAVIAMKANSLPDIKDIVTMVVCFYFGTQVEKNNG